MTLRPIPATQFERIPDELKEPLLQSGVFPVIDPLMALYNLPKGTNMVICIGGRGGAKSFEVSRFCVYEATTRGRRVAVLRDEKETIRESILNEIFLRYDTAQERGHFGADFEKSERGIKEKTTGNMVVFTKGFRASSNQKKTNLKGVSDTDTAIIEEAEDIRDFSKFNTFIDSIRTKDRLIIIMLNTPDIQHWVVKRFFNLEQVEDGYWKLIPKDLPGVVAIQTSYKDNIYLPADVVRDYEGSGDPNHHRYDPHYFKTEIQGFASSGRKGQILRKVKPIKLADYMALPYKEYYGQDFGTSSPAGLVGVKIHRNKCWFREINYKPMTPLELAKLYCTLKFNITDEIICDKAEPKTIAKLKNGYKAHELAEVDFAKYPQLAVGFNAIASIGGPDSISYGIGLMNEMELHCVEESVNAWEEITNWVYAKDKNGNYTDDPIDDFNHLIDPLRNVIHKKAGKPRMGSVAV